MKRWRQVLAGLAVCSATTFVLPGCVNEVLDVIRPPPDECAIGNDDFSFVLPCSWVD